MRKWGLDKLLTGICLLLLPGADSQIEIPFRLLLRKLRSNENLQGSNICAACVSARNYGSGMISFPQYGQVQQVR